MGVQQKRVFRIEKFMNQGSPMQEMFESDFSAEIAEPEQPVVAAVPDTPAPIVEAKVGSDYAEMHREIMETLSRMNDEISALKINQSQVSAVPVAPANNDVAVQEGVAEDEDDRIPPMSAEDIEDARKLRAELKDIYDAIEQTKVEILTIHQSGVNGMEISRVTDELGAIVGGTEKATETILETAEGIDQAAADLVAMLTDETTHGLASDIQDGVVKIFESCNFQDLTGQRISKVISAFRFIEERVIQMMEIWGGVDSFSEVETEVREDRQGDRALLNGPALDEDENVASQDDIDALFD